MVLSMDSAQNYRIRDQADSAALGFTREQNMAMVVIPIQGGYGLRPFGFGRAAGDTLIPTMLANAAQYAIRRWTQ